MIIFIYLWRFLSYDYTSLSELIHGETLFVIFKPYKYLLNIGGTVLFGSSIRIYSFQLFASVLLILAAWRLKRSYILISLIIPCLFESCAMLFRFQMYDSDFLVALLGIVVLYPFDLNSALSGGKVISKPATQLGFLLSAYCGGAYLLAGLSKLQIPYWWSEVHLELLYPAIEVWHGIHLPSWLDPIAFEIHRFFNEHQTLTAMVALVSLLAELGWILCLFFHWARYLFPPLMLGVHFGIFLSSGLLFFSMGVGAFLSVFPFRKLFDSPTHFQKNCVNLSSSSAASRIIIPLVFIFSLLIVPIYKPYTYPFANYYNFGWSYAKISSPGVIYRLGFFIPELGIIRQIPMNYGGFIDYRHISQPGIEIEGFLNAGSDEKRMQSNKHLSQFIKAIKGPDTNNWLLGSFSYPPHFFAETEYFPMEYFKNLFLLAGNYRFENGKLEITWINHGEFIPFTSKESASLADK